MADDQVKRPFHSLVSTVQAGILGGITAGLVEVLLICRFGAAPANLAGLFFASWTYGLLGGAVSVVLWAIFPILRLRREWMSSSRAQGASIWAASLSIILFLIFLCRVFRDIYADQVKYTQSLGLLTIAGLVIAALALFFIAKFVLNRILTGFLSWVLKPVDYTLSVGAVLIMGLILSASLSQDAEAVYAPFTPPDQAWLQGQPCVILILVDTLRPDRLGCYGAASVNTPHIDALARDAVLFRQAYVQAPFTKPSVASILTSRYPSEHRAIGETDALPDGVITLAEALSQAGCYCTGIVTNINVAPDWNFQQGFHQYVYLPPRFYFGANEASAQLVVYGVLWALRMKYISTDNVDHFYHNAEKLTAHFEKFLDQNPNRPFFIFLHYMDPHDPYFEHPYSGRGYARIRDPNPDPELVESYRDFYRQEVEYLDPWIGRVVDTLKRRGLYNNSLIIFTSDHGEEFQEHRGWWHSQTLHEELVRVPLLIKRQGCLGAGVEVENLVNAVDIAPTILGAIDRDYPVEMRGRDLFQNPGEEDKSPEVFAETDHAGNVAKMLRLGPWKYIETNPDSPRRRPPRQLFYLPDDPGEMNNLIDSEPEKAAELQRILQAKVQEALAARVESTQREMDQAARERLRALGYTQ